MANRTLLRPIEGKLFAPSQRNGLLLGPWVETQQCDLLHRLVHYVLLFPHLRINPAGPVNHLTGGRLSWRSIHLKPCQGAEENGSFCNEIMCLSPPEAFAPLSHLKNITRLSCGSSAMCPSAFLRQSKQQSAPSFFSFFHTLVKGWACFPWHPGPAHALKAFPSPSTMDGTAFSLPLLHLLLLEKSGIYSCLPYCTSLSR